MCAGRVGHLSKAGAILVARRAGGVETPAGEMLRRMSIGNPFRYASVKYRELTALKLEEGEMPVVCAKSYAKIYAKTIYATRQELRVSHTMPRAGMKGE